MSRTAEDAMFGTPAAERRRNECIANALADREALQVWWQAGVAMLREMHESRVTLCDAGCYLDLEGIMETFEPHSVERVTRAAIEIAIDREED